MKIPRVLELVTTQTDPSGRYARDMVLETLIIGFLILVPPSAAAQETPKEDQRTTRKHLTPRHELDQFKKLLPEEGFEGWTTVGGQARFVREGDLLRGLDSGSRNTFLMSDRSFGDFILEGEVKIESGNSGWQIRSHLSDTDDLRSRIRGYQIEVDPSDRGWSGGLYDEARRGWIHALNTETDTPSAFEPAEWNHYRIEVIGPRIRSWVNGKACADVVDLADLSGSIAFQVHSGDCRVQWKGLVITQLGSSGYTDDRFWEKEPAIESEKVTLNRSAGATTTTLSAGEEARVRSLDVKESFSIRLPYQVSEGTVLRFRMAIPGETGTAFVIGDSEPVHERSDPSRLPVVAPGAGMTGLGDEWRELFLDLDSARLVVVDEGLLQTRRSGVLEGCLEEVDLTVSCVRGEVVLGRPRVLEKTTTVNDGS